MTIRIKLLTVASLLCSTFLYAATPSFGVYTNPPRKTPTAPPMEYDNRPLTPSAPPMEYDNRPLTPTAPPMEYNNRPLTPSAPPMEYDNRPLTPTARQMDNTVPTQYPKLYPVLPNQSAPFTTTTASDPTTKARHDTTSRSTQTPTNNDNYKNSANNKNNKNNKNSANNKNNKNRENVNKGGGSPIYARSYSRYYDEPRYSDDYFSLGLNDYYSSDCCSSDCNRYRDSCHSSHCICSRCSERAIAKHSVLMGLLILKGYPKAVTSLSNTLHRKLSINKTLSKVVLYLTPPLSALGLFLIIKHNKGRRTLMT